jgi:hypothetical protein
LGNVYVDDLDNESSKEIKKEILKVDKFMDIFSNSETDRD